MTERFAMEILPAGRDEYDLLDCMLRIDREENLDPARTACAAVSWQPGWSTTTRDGSR